MALAKYATLLGASIIVLFFGTICLAAVGLPTSALGIEVQDEYGRRSALWDILGDPTGTEIQPTDPNTPNLSHAAAWMAEGPFGSSSWFTVLSNGDLQYGRQVGDVKVYWIYHVPKTEWWKPYSSPDLWAPNLPSGGSAYIPTYELLGRVYMATFVMNDYSHYPDPLSLLMFSAVPPYNPIPDVKSSKPTVNVNDMYTSKDTSLADRLWNDYYMEGIGRSDPSPSKTVKQGDTIAVNEYGEAKVSYDDYWSFHMDYSTCPNGACSWDNLPPAQGVSWQRYAFWKTMAMEMREEVGAYMAWSATVNLTPLAMPSEATAGCEQGGHAAYCETVGVYNAHLAALKAKWPTFQVAMADPEFSGGLANVEQQMSAYGVSKEDSINFCDGLYLPYYAPYGCAKMSQSYSTSIIAEDMPPDVVYHAGSTGDITWHQSGLFSGATDPGGVSSQMEIGKRWPSGELRYLSGARFIGDPTKCERPFLDDGVTPGCMPTPALYEGLRTEWVGGGGWTTQAPSGFLAGDAASDPMWQGSVTFTYTIVKWWAGVPNSGGEWFGPYYTPIGNWQSVVDYMSKLSIGDKVLFTLWFDAYNGMCGDAGYDHSDKLHSPDDAGAVFPYRQKTCWLGNLRLSEFDKWVTSRDKSIFTNTPFGDLTTMAVEISPFFSTQETTVSTVANLRVNAHDDSYVETACPVLNMIEWSAKLRTGDVGHDWAYRTCPSTPGIVPKGSTWVVCQGKVNCKSAGFSLVPLGDSVSVVDKIRLRFADMQAQSGSVTLGNVFSWYNVRTLANGETRVVFFIFEDGWCRYYGYWVNDVIAITDESCSVLLSLAPGAFNYFEYDANYLRLPVNTGGSLAMLGIPNTSKTLYIANLWVIVFAIGVPLFSVGAYVGVIAWKRKRRERQGL